MNRYGKRCVLYPRVSTEMQVDGYSLEGQKNMLTRFADREEMIVVDTYEDAGKSGKSIEGRPAFQKMLRDIEDGLDIDYILVYKLSRFGRNAADILNSLELVQSYGVNLICIEEGIDSSQTSGKLLISVLSAVAEIERENIIEQTMNGRREKARQGGWNGGFAPYGYTLEDNKLMIEETEAVAIRKIFELYTSSEIGLGGIANQLNLQGIRKIPRQNGTLEDWTGHFIKLILDNPVYCGKIAYGRRTKEKVKGTKNDYQMKRNDDYILTEGQHKGIVSEEVWEKAHAKRLRTGVKQPSKIGRDRVHLLSGLLKCPVCGSPMYTNKHAWTNKDGTYKEIYYYVCSRNRMVRGKHCEYKAMLKKTDIEPMVIEAIREIVRNEEYAQAIKKRIGVQIDTKAVDKELEGYQAKLKEVDLNKTRLEREIDSLPADAKYRERKLHDMTLRLDSLYDVIVELEEKIEDARLRRDAIKQQAITLENIYKIMVNFDCVYNIINDEEKRNVVTALIKEIEIYRNDESEYPLKRIGLNFPVFKDGGEVTELLWDKGNTVDAYYFLNMLMNRDEISLMHSILVERLALVLLRHVMDEKPELLVGMRNTANVVEVLEKRGEFEKFVSDTALFYDIGKLNYLELILLQNRRLEPEEMELLREHSREGYEMLKKLNFDPELCDVALGHHKSYDGKHGYPANFDHTASSARFMIDLFRICDRMEAATDEIGRVYRQNRGIEAFWEELKLGAGYLYQPQLVEMILNDDGLRGELSYLCSGGRMAVYYSAYHDFVGGRVEKKPNVGAGAFAEAELLHQEQAGTANMLLANIQEENRGQRQVLASLAKSTILLARICLDEDHVYLVHHIDDPVLEGLQEGTFQEFADSIVNQCVHPDDLQQVKRLRDYGVLGERLMSMDGSFELEIRVWTKDHYRWMRLQFVMAEEKNGSPQVVVLSVRDIDTVKKQQEQLKEAMEFAQEQAERANRAKSIFLSNMSHDIRTPMNAIMGMTRIASENIGEPERVMDCLGKIEQASGHLLKLINEVLNMSKIESGRMELIEKPILIHSVVDNVLMLLQDNIEKKKMTLQVDMDRLPEESVYGDATRILEILLNLASNAVKYTPEGGTIRFLAEKREEIGSDQIYRFVVQDNGIGMSKEFLEKLFEPFAREQKVADGKFEGTGLGMSITKAFVEMMGGDIRVDSKEGEGTTFEVLLRFKKAEAAVVEELGKVWTMDECRGRFAQNRLLLAEDNELNREILKELIRETGISIEEAVNGKEAVRLVQNNPEDYFDLVFMDVQMPEMDGYEAVGRIRQYEKKLKRKHLPIIALTANVFAEDSERALRAGMDAHMGKPVEVPQLLATMMHWIG